MSNYTDSIQPNSNELYEALSPEIRDKLIAHEQIHTVPAGTLLINHGVCPEFLTIVNSGLVEVSLAAGERIVPLTVAGKGKVFGLRTLVSGELPEIDATTLEECQIALVPAERFLEILKRNPPMYLAIARVLSADLRIADSFRRQRLTATPRRTPATMVV